MRAGGRSKGSSDSRGNRPGHIALPSRPYCMSAATQRLEVRLKPKGPEDYRRLAEKCRETAHTVSTEKERADLLAMAQIWDLIAGRVGHAPRCERPAAAPITVTRAR